MKWFKHETDAHTNLKIQEILEKFGKDSLAIFGYYWAINELIGLQGHDDFCVKKEKNWKNYFKKQFGIETDQQEKFLKCLAGVNLISKKALKSGDLCNPKLAERSDDYTRRLRTKSDIIRTKSDNVHLEQKRTEENRREQMDEGNKLPTTDDYGLKHAFPGKKLTGIDLARESRGF